MSWRSLGELLGLDTAGTDWMADGACIGMDPDMWFPGRGFSSEPAKKVCRGCPVREACLEYALDTRQKYGVWGGMSERERRRLRGQRVMRFDAA